MGQLPSRCWSSCLCKVRGFGADRALDDGHSSASSRLEGAPRASLRDWERWPSGLQEVCYLRRTVVPSEGAIGGSSCAASQKVFGR